MTSGPISARTRFISPARSAPRATSIAIEPQGFLHQILNTNLLLNEILNVRALRVGIGRDCGQAWIPPIDYGTVGNFGSVALQRQQGAEAVPVVPLDSLQLPQCHFIKVDVEGMEEDVIAGATETIRKFQPILYVENDRPEKSSALIERISGLGYAAYWHLPNYYSPDNPYGNPINVFLGMVSVNMICVPPGRLMDLDGLERITDRRRHPIDDFKSSTLRLGA